MKAIFFDLDDTLHDHQKPFRDAFSQTLPDLSIEVSVEDYYKKFRECSDVLWGFYTKHQLTLEELRVQRIIQGMSHFKKNITREQAGKFQDTYQRCLENLELFPSVPELLETLKKKGYQIGIITNGPVRHQMNKIKVLGLLKYIKEENIFISDAVGFAKPNPKLFQYIAEKNNLSPKDLLYVGDTWNNDIVGSFNAGWQSVWFNHRKRKPESDITTLGEIESLMSLINVLECITDPYY